MTLQPDSVWCGICVGYRPHDTAHHTSGGAPVAGDLVTLTNPSDEWAHMKGKRGRVESVRNDELTVAFPSQGGTVSLQVSTDAVT